MTVNGVASLTFTQDDIDNGLVEFTHDGSLTLAASFDVSLADGGEAGALPDTATFTMDILHPPSLDVNTGTTVFEATPDAPSVNTITTAMLSASDFDTADTGVFYNVTTAPANGYLALAADPNTPITSFTQDDIANNRVLYIHDGSETTADTFAFEIFDGYYTLPEADFDIVVIPQNDKAQITTNIPPSIEVSGSIVIDSTYLQGTDPDDTDADITFTASNIQNGTLYVNGVPGTVFTQQDINDGLISFEHDGTNTVTGGFDLVLQDGLEHGATVDTGTFVINIEFLPVLDTNAGMTVLEGTVFAPSDTNVISTAELNVTDFDTPDTDLVFTVITAPVNGHLALIADPSTPITSFTQDDIANGRLVYNHDGSETTADSFVFEITDGFYTLPVETFDITITPQNDPPTDLIVPDRIFIENTLPGTIISDWRAIDSDGPSHTVTVLGGMSSIFGANSDGMYVKQALDYEVDPHSYTMTLRLSDGQYSIDRVVTIELGDMNETPVTDPNAGVQQKPAALLLGDLGRPNTPINDFVASLEGEEVARGSFDEIVRAGSLQGQEGLNIAYYGGDVPQIIRENVTEKIDTRDTDRIGQDLPDILTRGQIVFDGIDYHDVDDQQDQRPAPEPEIFVAPDVEDGPTTISSLEALLLDVDGDEGSDLGKDESADTIAEKYVQNTNIQLDEASALYDKKRSSLEKVLKSK